MSEQYRYGQMPTPVSEKVEVTLTFNRVNGEYLSASTVPFDIVDQDDPYCIYVKDMMDLNNQDVVGKMEKQEDGTFKKAYQIVNHEDMPETIHEEALDNMVANKITTRYPVVEQINIICRAIQELAAKHDHELPELEEYLEFVNLCKATNRAHKEFYAEAEDVVYISKEDQLKSEIEKFEGGLHEIMGPRLITGGKVF